LTSNATGTTFAQVSGEILKAMPCPLPPLSEQRLIVERIESLFEKLDHARELVQSALDSFETRKAAILHKAFTGELTANWRKENGVGIDSWEKVSFESLIKSGPQNGLYKPKNTYGNGTKIIRIDGFYDGYVEPWNTIKRLRLDDSEVILYELKVGDIIINRVNSMTFLGKSALIRELPERCVFESNIMRLEVDSEQLLPEYIIQYLNSPTGLGELRKNTKQAVNQASINQQDVKKVIVPLPKIKEQQEIVFILNRLLEEEQSAKDKLESLLKQIDLTKKSILARAFRGGLGTNDLSEESALELLKEVLSENQNI